MPKIVDVRPYCLAVYYKDLYSASGDIPKHVLWPIPHAQVTPRDGSFATIVEIEDDQGNIGMGECLATMAPQVTQQIIKTLFAPVLLGENPLDMHVLWQRLYHIGRLNGQNRGFNLEAISGIDIALWDLAGKILDQPIYQLLGGKFRDQIKTYASPVPIMEKQTEAIALAESFVRDGFAAIKVKVGRPDFRKDIDLVRGIRSALGNDIQIMLDANGAYDTLTALKFGQGVAPFDVFWFEEPFYPEDVDVYLGLKRDIAIPLAAGECESTHYNYKKLIISRAVDVVQPNISRVGGFTAARNVAAMADAHNIPVAPHGVGGAIFLAASLQFSAAIPNFISLEYNRRPNPLREGLIDGGFDFQNGCLSIPSGPGLGIQINPKSLKKVRV